MKLKLFETLLSEETYINLYQKHYKNLFDKDDNKDLNKFNEIIRLDPTFKESSDKEGKYTRWLLKKNNIDILKNTLDEDLYKIRKDLDKFNKALIMKKLPKGKNDIYKFDINSLSRFIFDNFPDEELKSKTKEIEEIKKQVDKYQLDNWLVVVPKTMLASCYYGAHTKWCTAATDKDYKDNKFNDYNSQGELYIFINISNPKDKYQFHFEEFQLKDVVDKDVDFEKFFKKNRDVFNFLFNIFNKKYPSEEDKLKIIRESRGNIIFVKNPSEQVQLAAVEQDWAVIRHIENPTKAVQLAAVRQNGEAIRSIIEKIGDPSEAVQLAAVEQDEWLIQYIENPTEAVQLAAVEQNGEIIRTIIIMIREPSEEVQLAAVKQDGEVIKYIIEKIGDPSEAVQLAAVRQDGYAIRHIGNPSEEVQLAAVRQNGEAIGLIIDKIGKPSEAVQLAAVKQNVWVVTWIENPSEEVLLAAVETDCYVFIHIKPEYRTQRVIDYYNQNCI